MVVKGRGEGGEERESSEKAEITAPSFHSMYF